MKATRDRIQLWFAAPDEISDPGLLEAYRGVLNPEERARHRRFILPRHRHQFLVARALVRTTLSRYADVDPAAWTFSFNEHGRPELDGPPGAPPLRFNLSHADGLMVCGVVRRRELGVDVEDRSRRVRSMAIVDRFFAPREVRDLRALPEAEQLTRFFDYWTLKESYIKARGMGLALPLGKFAFSVHRGRPLGLSTDPALQDDPAGWRHALLRPTARHTAAVTVARRRGGLPLLETFRVVPLLEARPAPDLQVASTEQPYLL